MTTQQKLGEPQSVDLAQPSQLGRLAQLGEHQLDKCATGARHGA
jgi:hypothetical protein